MTHAALTRLDGTERPDAVGVQTWKEALKFVPPAPLADVRTVNHCPTANPGFVAPVLIVTTVNPLPEPLPRVTVVPFVVRLTAGTDCST